LHWIIPSNTKWLSLVSVWEMQIGKLTLEKPLTKLIAQAVQQNFGLLRNI